ncbi:MAG: hypothetical protein ABIP23_05305 [Pelobium sp.]
MIQQKVAEWITKENLALQHKNAMLNKLAKNPAVNKTHVANNDRYAEELIKAAGISILVSFLISKIFKIRNPVIKALLIPAITSAIMKSELFDVISKRPKQKLIENQ